MNMRTKKDRPGSWTIHDVARLAGVSAKTVSRVINAEPGVGPVTRTRVTEIIREVGYEPHTGARSMRSQRRDCVGIVFPAPAHIVPISQDFFVWLFGNLYRTFGMCGNFICFDPSPDYSDPAADYARGLWQQRYTGCIVCGPLAVNDIVIHRIHRAGHPYVSFGRLDSLPECSFATVDYEAGAHLSTSFLIQRGHRRIALLKTFRGYQPGVERLRGYRRALEEAGLPFDEQIVRAATFTSAPLADAVHYLLQDPSVTALIDCSGHEDAQGLREGGRRAGRVLGTEVEVLSWTYTDNAAVLTEAVAHLWLPVREAAAEGVSLFRSWYESEIDGPIQVLFRPTLYEQVTNGEICQPKPLFSIFR